RPDTACGLQAEKTGRFSLHRRDNTRPDKHSASGSFAFAISLKRGETLLVFAIGGEKNGSTD
ncbi:hypothetical protein, partial [Escherichia coli]